MNNNIAHDAFGTFSVFVKDLVRELSRVGRRPPKSKAAKFNAHTLRKLQAAVEKNPEIDLTTQMPMDYSVRLVEFREELAKEALEPLNGNSESTPPQDLVDGEWDEQLKRVVLDHFLMRQLRDTLGDAIDDYRNEWVRCMANAEHDFKGIALNTITFELCEAESHVLRAKQPQITRAPNDLGLDAERIASEDVGVPSSIQSTERSFPKEWKKNIKKLCALIDVQLWRIKLLFCDGVKLVDNMNKGDVLNVFKEEGTLIKAFSLHYDKRPQSEHDAPGIAAAEALRRLLHRHYVVMAKARMLRFCESIDERISSRNTGYTVLLS